MGHGHTKGIRIFDNTATLRHWDELTIDDGLRGFWGVAHLVTEGQWHWQRCWYWFVSRCTAKACVVVVRVGLRNWVGGLFRCILYSTVAEIGGKSRVVWIVSRIRTVVVDLSARLVARTVMDALTYVTVLTSIALGSILADMLTSGTGNVVRGLVDVLMYAAILSALLVLIA